ncbi:UrcA family protein [Terricaulis sp.]|uniref:UrcA family protein n=1 Tax=Terricaulis sp. TaxID=2768686 RepID=UPI003784D63F
MNRPVLFALVSGLAIALASASPALAQDQRREIHYADLDLSNVSGADALINRIRQNARVYCGEHPGPMMWSEYRYVESCRRETELQDLDAVGDANVRARYEQRYGYGSATAALQ